MDAIADDVGRLVAWMGEHGRLSIEGGKGLWVNDLRMRDGWFVQWFHEHPGSDPDYTNGDDTTLLGALHKALGDAT